MHSFTQAWNISASSSGQSAMHPARDPPGQLGLAVLAGVVVVVDAVVVVPGVCCVVVGAAVVVVVVVVSGSLAVSKHTYSNFRLIWLVYRF